MRYENDRADYEFMTKLRALEAQRWKDLEVAHAKRLEDERLAKIEDEKLRLSEIFEQEKAALLEIAEQEMKRATEAKIKLELEKEERRVYAERMIKIEREAAEKKIKDMTDKMTNDGYIISRNDLRSITSIYYATKDGITIHATPLCCLFEKIYGTSY